MKSFFTYLFLVGVPAAGLLGILHVGRGLHAPPAIGGEWRIAAGPLAGSTFVVQQSGEHLSLVLPVDGGIQLRGKSRGDTIELSNAGSLASHAQPCGRVQGTALRAVLDLSAGLRMHGAATVGDCPAVPFDAVRVTQPAKKGGGH